MEGKIFLTMSAYLTSGECLLSHNYAQTLYLYKYFVPAGGKMDLSHEYSTVLFLLVRYNHLFF